MIRHDKIPSPSDPSDDRTGVTGPGDAGAEDLHVVGASGEASAPGTPAASEIQRQRDEYYDLLLRKTAEFDNYRRRVERERRELAEYATGEFVKELLPIFDDFGRALAAAANTSAGDAFRQGIELIHRRLLDALAKRGVTVIDPLGEMFDPHLHEAVTRAPAQDRPDGEVVEVFSRGYKLGDRLLRPAMVKVATA